MSAKHTPQPVMFDLHFQKHFLAYALRDTDFLAQVADRVEPWMFADDYSQRLILLIKSFWAANKTAPGTLIFAELDALHAQGLIADETKTLTSAFADDLFLVILQNKNHVLKRVNEFFKSCAYQRLLPKVTELARQCKFEECETQLAELLTYSPCQQAVSARLIDLATVQPQCVLWLWPRRIALGKLTLIGGDCDCGKSTFLMWLVAQATTGNPWPGESGGTTNEPGSAVIVSAEDGIADTIVPRLIAAGADLGRVTALQGVEQATGKPARSFTLADLPALEDAIKNKPDCRLVAIDPISAYMGRADSHNNAAVRGLLEPLQELAERYRVAVVFILHSNKGNSTMARNKISGSSAYVDAPRSAWLVSRDDDDKSRILFSCIKNNIGKDADKTTLAYSIISAPTNPDVPIIAWHDGTVDICANDILANGADTSQTKIEKAQDWLGQFLATGPQEIANVRDSAASAGFSWRTVKRAKLALGVAHKAYNVRGINHTWWALPSYQFPPTPPGGMQNGSLDMPPPTGSLGSLGSLAEKHWENGQNQVSQPSEPRPSEPTSNWAN